MNLNQITIYTPNSVATTEFYRRLGLKLIVDSLPRYARLECPDGESTLSVHYSEADAGNGIVLYFECGDLDAQVDELKAAGIAFDTDPADQPWLWREAYLTDPAGTRVCLFFAGENRKNPPWKIV